MSVHSDIPVWTYLLDALGAFGIIVGGYVATKSTYAKENSRDAAVLIDTQRKRIDTLEETTARQDRDIAALKKQNHQQQGELVAYRRLNYIEPEVVTKLTTTLDNILTLLQKSNIEIISRDKQ